eukprot:COSAG05_NODE_162_length_15499_cov_23.006104_8_plen_168_part_00
MGKCAQLVIGPAGSGKSTFCNTIQEHCEVTGRTVHIINLDPAAEVFRYTPTMDVRDLVSVDDVMEELQLGPNGALVYAMEYLLENSEWLEEELDGYGPDDYLILDCPGAHNGQTHALCAHFALRALVIRSTGPVQAKSSYTRICRCFGSWSTISCASGTTLCAASTS